MNSTVSSLRNYHNLPSFLCKRACLLESEKRGFSVTIGTYGIWVSLVWDAWLKMYSHNYISILPKTISRDEFTVINSVVSAARYQDKSATWTPEPRFVSAGWSSQSVVQYNGTRNFDKRRKTDVGLRPPLRNTDPRETENATRPPHLPSLGQPKLCHRHINSPMQIAMNYVAFFVSLGPKLDLDWLILRFLDHTQLDTNSRYDCSRRAISTSQIPLPTKNQRKTRISMPLAEFEPVIWATASPTVMYGACWQQMWFVSA